MSSLEETTSTKRTIDHEFDERTLNWNNKGKRKRKPKTSLSFHLFTDMEDDRDACGTVHLRLDKADFVAYPGSVEVCIPPDVWNRIVLAGPVKVRRTHGTHFSDNRPEFPKQVRVKPAQPVTSNQRMLRDVANLAAKGRKKTKKT